MKRKTLFSLFLALTAVAFCTTSASADHKKKAKLLCKYHLDTSGDEMGRAKVKVIKKGHKYFLKIKVRDAFPDKLYTVWIDHRSRATLTLADDYPLDEGALPRGVAPAFASTAGVTAGMGPDDNAIFTDEDGDANFIVKLDYNILASGSSPVVGADLSTQGMNVVGGHWLRMYDVDPETAASVQLVDPETGLPMLHRSTPQGLTLVRHDDNTTHGHSPGVGGVDHFPAWKGDFPSECMMD